MLAPLRARRPLECILRSPRPLECTLRSRRTFASTPRRFDPNPARPSLLGRTFTAARYTGYFCLSSVVGVLAIGAGFFVHDAFTYNEKHVERVPVSPLALHPETGGPKNLPIVRVGVADEEDEEHKKLASKPRLVIVGGGWGVCAHSIVA
jgi:NADH dehydrogenase